MPFEKLQYTEDNPEENPLSNQLEQISVVKEILDEIKGNKELEELFIDFVKCSLEYSSSCAKLSLSVKQKYLDPDNLKSSIGHYDSQRRRKHELVIDAINILARACIKIGKSANWKTGLTNRDAIGNLARRIAIHIDVFDEPAEKSK